MAFNGHKLKLHREKETEKETVLIRGFSKLESAFSGNDMLCLPIDKQTNSLAFIYRQFERDVKSGQRHISYAPEECIDAKYNIEQYYLILQNDIADADIRQT